MNPGIFLRQDSALVPMEETPYEAEAMFQELLADFPELLVAGSGGRVAQYALIGREVAISSVGASPSNWSADHIFVDDQGVPTIVEVKRSSDSRIRREVVGQMLDYAANAGAHWGPDGLRERFEARCEDEGTDPDSTLTSLLGGIDNVDDYWTLVRSNMISGRLRLVFVADSIPPELQRVVEFLNAQMNLTEVIAIEVKQYVDKAGEHQTYVPRVVGQSETVKQLKRQSTGTRWTLEAIVDDMRNRDDSRGVRAVERIVEWAQPRADLQVEFGTGKVDGSLLVGRSKDGRLWPIAIYTYGKFEVQFQHMLNWPPFNDVAAREQLRDKLELIPGLAFPENSLERRPSFPLDVIDDDESFRLLTDALDWAFEAAREANRSAPS